MWCEASLEVRGKSTRSYSNVASEYLVPPQLVDLPGGSLGGRASFEVSTYRDSQFKLCFLLVVRDRCPPFCSSHCAHCDELFVVLETGSYHVASAGLKFAM